MPTRVPTRPQLLVRPRHDAWRDLSRTFSLETVHTALIVLLAVAYPHAPAFPPNSITVYTVTLPCSDNETRTFQECVRQNKRGRRAKMLLLQGVWLSPVCCRARVPFAGGREMPIWCSTVTDVKRPPPVALNWKGKLSRSEQTKGTMGNLAHSRQHAFSATHVESGGHKMRQLVSSELLSCSQFFTTASISSLQTSS